MQSNVKVNTDFNAITVKSVMFGDVHLVNVMKHDADLVVNGKSTKLPASGIVAECQENTSVGEDFIGIPTIKVELGKITNLPFPTQNVVYYVNRMVFNKAVADGRTDVVMGDSGRTALRNEKGWVVGITHLITP